MSIFCGGGKVMNNMNFSEIINGYLSFKRMYVRHNTMISYEETIVFLVYDCFCLQIYIILKILG